MAAKNRKRYKEWQEFKQWKDYRKRVRAQYVFAEEYHRDVFEIFKKYWKDGEINSLEDMHSFDVKFTVNSMRMIIDSLEDVDKWMRKIPHIHFKEDWAVKALPGTFGAMSRIWINQDVSIYLDVFDRLGFVGQPYWEIYDGKETNRFLMNDIEGLLECINKVVSFNQLPEETQNLLMEMEARLKEDE
jgi:hypothetical protein